MNADRRLWLWRLVVEQADGSRVAVRHVGAAMITATGVGSAAVTVTLGATTRETVYASDQVAGTLEELALILGEGPGVDAVTGGPALVADLAAKECLARWPTFAPAAIQTGVRAAFALPLQVGAIRLGVIDLYRAQPGGLDREQVADALLLADTACTLLLNAAHDTRPHVNGYRPDEAGPLHPEVHQATGMITVLLGVSPAVALLRLRGYAYANDRRLRDVAADVVARRLRFEPEPDNG